jgi:hypothetical protein
MENKLIIFIDNIGRTIVGEQVNSTSDKSIKVKNPAIIWAQPNQQNGQLNIQVIPLFFRELLAGKSKEEGVIWEYLTSNITIATNLELDTRLTSQYRQITSAQPVIPSGAGTPPKVIKLFDSDEDEKKA